MTKFYAPRNLVIRVEEALDDGILETLESTQQIYRGELVSTNLNGDKDVLNYKVLNERYVEVKVKEESKFTCDDIANAYASMSEWNVDPINEDQEYITGTGELAKNKAF